jgi:hypothetical protein
MQGVRSEPLLLLPIPRPGAGEHRGQIILEWAVGAGLPGCVVLIVGIILKDYFL